MIKLRTYYIFKINKYFAYIYKKWPYKMYKIIEELYYTKEYDMLISYKYYKKFAIEFNKLVRISSSFGFTEYLLILLKQRFGFCHYRNVLFTIDGRL